MALSRNTTLVRDLFATDESHTVSSIFFSGLFQKLTGEGCWEPPPPDPLFIFTSYPPLLFLTPSPLLFYNFLCASKGGTEIQVSTQSIYLFIYLFIYLSVCNSSTGQSFPHILTILYPKVSHGTRTLLFCDLVGQGQRVNECKTLYVMTKYVLNFLMESENSFAG